MARLPLHNVRVLALREIAELWAIQVELPEETILRELQLAVINLPRLDAGEGFIDPHIPDEELPSPDVRVDRDWLEKFCQKQGWPKPEFWFDEPQQPASRFPGRPVNPLRMVIEREFMRRGEEGELDDRLTATVRSLRQWVVENFPDERPPSEKTLQNNLRDRFQEFKRRNRI